MLQVSLFDPVQHRAAVFAAALATAMPMQFLKTEPMASLDSVLDVCGRLESSDPSSSSSTVPGRTKNEKRRLLPGEARMSLLSRFGAELGCEASGGIHGMGGADRSDWEALKSGSGGVSGHNSVKSAWMDVHEEEIGQCQDSDEAGDVGLPGPWWAVTSSVSKSFGAAAADAEASAVATAPAFDEAKWRCLLIDQRPLPTATAAWQKVIRLS